MGVPTAAFISAERSTARVERCMISLIREMKVRVGVSSSTAGSPVMVIEPRDGS